MGRAMLSEVAQSCSILCNPIDYSLPCFSIHGIFQARVLEWVAISFSRGIFPTQGSPPSMGFSRQEYWSGLPLTVIEWNLVTNLSLIFMTSHFGGLLKVKAFLAHFLSPLQSILNSNAVPWLVLANTNPLALITLGELLGRVISF